MSVSRLVVTVEIKNFDQSENVPCNYGQRRVDIYL